MESIFVCYKDWGYGRMSVPLIAFNTRELAEEYCDKQNRYLEDGEIEYDWSEVSLVKGYG